MSREVSERSETLLGPVDDETLIRGLIATREQLLFIELMDRHLPRVRRLLYGLLNANPEDIQDVEQELLTHLWRDIGSFEFRSSFETYLYRIARNRAIDHLRREQRRKRLVQQLRDSAPREPLADHRAAGEERAAVAALLARLPERERLVITLRELEGMALEQIAEIAGVAIGTVKSRLHRGRRRIAKLMEEGR